MENLLNVPLTGWVYPVMYLAAFTAGVSYILIEAKRNKWPVDSIALMLCCTILSAVIGSKIVMILPDLILRSINAGQLQAAWGKSFLGGAAGGVIGMLMAIRILRLPLEVSDKVALVLPVSLALGRIGCLFAGCCFGTVTGARGGLPIRPGRLRTLLIIPIGMVLNGPIDIWVRGHPWKKLLNIQNMKCQRLEFVLLLGNQALRPLIRIAAV